MGHLCKNQRGVAKRRLILVARTYWQRTSTETWDLRLEVAATWYVPLLKHAVYIIRIETQVIKVFWVPFSANPIVRRLFISCSTYWRSRSKWQASKEIRGISYQVKQLTRKSRLLIYDANYDISTHEECFMNVWYKVLPYNNKKAQYPEGFAPAFVVS